MSDVAIKKPERRSILPACGIYGDESSMVLRVEMPGVHKDDIDIRIDGDQLSITGRVSEEASNGTWLLRERRRGDFERSFTIDNTIDRDHIDAVYERGIMTLTLRVKDEVKPRKIEITGK